MRRAHRLFGATYGMLSSSMLAVLENLVILPGALFFMYFHKPDLVTASLSSRKAATSAGM